MKDLYKNPTLYYILVPVMMGLWPLVVRGLYLPQAKDTLDGEIEDSRVGQGKALAILMLDPDRFADSNDGGAEFSYATVVHKIAGLCNIPASKYRLTSGMIITKDKQKTQSAHLRLEQVGIIQFAKFLSLIQLRWGTLQCDSVKLSKVEGLPDIWTVEIKFKYYY